jgi:hypothetical protein
MTKNKNTIDISLLKIRLSKSIILGSKKRNFSVMTKKRIGKGVVEQLRDYIFPSENVHVLRGAL